MKMSHRTRAPRLIVLARRAAALCVGWILLLVLALAPRPALAQAGNNNPTGVAGQFNGNVLSAGSYDPLTGNATRGPIADLSIAGAAGQYGLSYTRTWNSRGAAGWRDNWGWSVAGGGRGTGPIASFTVNFPDGRVETFPRAGQQSGTWRAAATGVRERFVPPPTPTNTGSLCYLLLPDGGKIEFQVTRTLYSDPELRPPTWYEYDFAATAMIDPYGLRTTFTYIADYTQITEPAGRWLRIFYNATGQVTHVDGSDGRTVVYTYSTTPVPGATASYTLLTSVRYFNDPSLDATYTYRVPNVGSANGLPLLGTCIDSMYAGPMKEISYTYATANNPDNTPAVYGQILSENHRASGAAVSTLTMNTADTRTETRGDGPARTFTYLAGKLQSTTDFRNVSTSQTYDASGYLNSMTDRRGNTTDYTREPITGNVTLTTFPLTGFDGGVRSTASVVYGSASCPDPNNRDGNNPYYVYSVTNERGYTTIYTRDANKRVARIDYPTTAYETFAYNGFGQVTSHRMTNGSTETFEYNASGQLTASRSPLHQSGNPTMRYSYDGLGRLWKVTDALGGYVGDPSRSTAYEYNARGQVTRVTHPDASYVQYLYNPDGTLASVTDELNHATTYLYDDYKRVLSVRNALNQGTWNNYAQDWVNPYLHTTSNPKAVSTPLGKQAHYAYDGNWQRTSMREAPATSDDAWTYYNYDAAGNQNWEQDPRGNVRSFAYDERNRRTSATDPAPFNNQITRWEYDRAGNVTKTIRSDGLFATTQFDPMNRPLQTNGFGNESTRYEYDLAGNVTRLYDAKNVYYSFSYDALNRKTIAVYPPDIGNFNRTESWRYDTVGNMDQYKNPADQLKTITYDNRNRPTNSSWSAGSAPSVTTAYDAASRVTSIAKNNNETVVAFGYDDANRKIWEDQTLAGFPTRRVETASDADGLRTYVFVAGIYQTRYDYTGRGQLKNIYDYNWNPWVRYTYDLNGNLIKRQNVYAGVNDSLNIPSANYDALNRPLFWENTGAGDASFARSHMDYDSLSRLTDVWREEQTNKGERYGYDSIGQLISVRYNADNVWTGTPSGGTLTTYNIDALNRTGSNGVNADGMLTAFAFNPMNQYTTVGTQAPNYTSNFNLNTLNGWTYNYDAEKHLTSATLGRQSASFVYDGLGRCVKRTINGVTTLLTYDGWKPILEWDGTGNFAAYNIYGPGPDEILWRYRASDNRHLRYHHDRQGNVVFLLDWNGTGLEKYTYDAFGQPTITNWDGTGARTVSNYGNRFMFTGREWLSELGIYDYRNRMYSPQLGRFLQPDPIGFGGGDANLFRYCAGDPVNRSDPMGLLSRQPSNNGKPPPQIRPNEPFRGASYTPTGSNIPLTSAQAIAQGYGATLNGFSNFIRDSVPGGFSSSASFGDLARSAFSSAGLALDGNSYSLGGGSVSRGYVAINGEKYYTSAEIVKALQSASPGSVASLTFVGHGTNSSIQVGFTGAFIYTADYNGGYNFSFNGYSNINAIFSSLAPDAVVNFYGCNTADGSSNLTQAFSSTFSGTTVTGYRGDAWAFGIPGFAPVATWGTTATYQNGQPISGGP